MDKIDPKLEEGSKQEDSCLATGKTRSGIYSLALAVQDSLRPTANRLHSGPPTRRRRKSVLETRSIRTGLQPSNTIQRPGRPPWGWAGAGSVAGRFLGSCPCDIGLRRMTPTSGTRPSKEALLVPVRILACFSGCRRLRNLSASCRIRTSPKDSCACPVNRTRLDMLPPHP